jgi:hypothetical protein
MSLRQVITIARCSVTWTTLVLVQGNFLVSSRSIDTAFASKEIHECKSKLAQSHDRVYQNPFFLSDLVMRLSATVSVKADLRATIYSGTNAFKTMQFYVYAKRQIDKPLYLPSIPCRHPCNGWQEHVPPRPE